MKNRDVGRDAGATQHPAASHEQPGAELTTTPRVKWSRAELLAMRRRQQDVVDRFARLRREPTGKERAQAVIALRTIRAISKVLAQMRKGGRA